MNKIDGNLSRTWVLPFARLTVWVFILVLFLPNAVAQKSTAVQESKNPYDHVVRSVLERLKHLTARHTFDPTLNESLAHTAEGGRYYLETSNLARAKASLDEALETVPNNPLAHLFLGDIAVLEGKKEVAIRSYIDFWNTTEKQSELLRALLSPEDRKAIAAHVSGRLLIYGMDLPDKERGEDLPLQLEMSLEKPSLARILVAFGLPILIAAGIPFFMYRRLFSIDPSPTADRILLQIYFVMLLSYFLWLGHHFFGWKALFFNREWEVLTFLAVGMNAVFALECVRRVWQREKERRDPDTVFCPHCGKSILKLATICPFCNEPVITRPTPSPRCRTNRSVPLL